MLADLQTVVQRFGGAQRSGSDAALGQVRLDRRRQQHGELLDRGGRHPRASTWRSPARPGYEPDPGVLAKARADERGRITVLRDPAEAAAGRQVVSTDVFASMGQEAEAEARRKAFAGYAIDAALMRSAHPDAIVLHCLPAHRGEEITDEVIEGPASAVWQQAENRLHAQKALLELLIP